MRPHAFQVDEPIYRPQQVVRRNVTLERELVEQRHLVDLPLPNGFTPGFDAE